MLDGNVPCDSDILKRSVRGFDISSFISFSSLLLILSYSELALLGSFEMILFTSKYTVGQK